MIKIILITVAIRMAKQLATKAAVLATTKTASANNTGI